MNVLPANLFKADSVQAMAYRVSLDERDLAAVLDAKILDEDICLFITLMFPDHAMECESLVLNDFFRKRAPALDQFGEDVSKCLDKLAAQTGWPRPLLVDGVEYLISSYMISVVYRELERIGMAGMRLNVQSSRLNR